MEEENEEEEIEGEDLVGIVKEEQRYGDLSGFSFSELFLPIGNMIH